MVEATNLTAKAKKLAEIETILSENNFLRQRKSTLLFQSDNIESHFSSYTKIVRMLGWKLRFLFNSYNQKNQGASNLTDSVINETKKRIIEIIQNEFLWMNMLKV